MSTPSYHTATQYANEPGGLRRLDALVAEIRTRFSKRIPSTVRILDVGCGRGNISRPLAHLGYTVTALDPDHSSIAFIQEICAPKNLTAHVCSFEEFDPRERFDVIIISEVLEHLKNPRAALQRAHELLTDDGILLLTVPNGWSIEELVRRVTGAHPTLKKLKRSLKGKISDRTVQTMAEHSPHLHFWSLKNIRHCIASRGFTVVTAKGLTSFVKEWFYLVGRLFIRRGSRAFRTLDRLDGVVIRHLPRPLAFGWLLVCTKHPDSRDTKNDPLSLVVVTYNNASTIQQCIEAINASTKGLSVEIIIVDNASTDATRDLVSSYPNVHSIQRPTNDGFAAGANEGARHASSPLLLFVNPDTELHPHTILELRKTLERDRSIGIVGGHFVTRDHQDMVSFGHFPSRWTEFLRATKLDRVFPIGRYVRPTFFSRSLFDRTHEVDWVSGGCLLIRTDLFTRIGGFDEQYFLYMEDVDLAKRVKDSGARVVFCSTATLIHAQHRSHTKSARAHERASLLSYRQKFHV